MLIRSIAVRGYRAIRALNLELAPGLNVIWGDNEIGKSTLRQAIQSGLFQRSTVSGTALDAMRPYDGGTPEVDLRFVHSGVEYDLAKRFGPKGTTRLVVRPAAAPARQLNGDDAEAELRTVLGVGETRGLAVRDGASYAPIIWVSQRASGRSIEADLDNDGRRALGQRLGELSGVALGDLAGGALEQAVNEEYEYFYTPTARGERAPLRLARQELESATRDRASLQACAASHEANLDEYESVAQRIAGLEAQIPTLEATLADAQTRVEAAQRAAESVEALRAEANEARARAAREEQTAHRRQELRERVTDIARQQERCAQAAEDARSVLAQHDAARAALQEDARSADAQLEKATVHARRGRAQVELAGVRERTKQAAARLGKARKAHADLVAARGRLASIRVTEADAKEIDRLQRAVDKAEDRLEHAATGVRLRALADTNVALDGAERALVRGEIAEHVIAKPATLRIARLLDVEILPGGEDLASRREALARARKDLDKTFECLGIADVAAVHAQLDDRKSLERDIDAQTDVLDSIAPDGIESMEEAVAADRARVEQLEAELGADAGSITAARAAAALREAEAGHAEQERTAARARKALDRHIEQRVELADAVAAAEKTYVQARSDASHATQALDDHAAMYGDDTAVGVTLLTARADSEAKGRALAEAERAWNEMSPSMLDAEAKRAHKAVVSAQRELQQCRETKSRLEGALCEADAIGLHDRLDAASAREERAQRELDALLERAEAIRSLYATLCECRRETEARYLKPLEQRFTPMLRTLFPDARVVLDEQYRVVQIERGRCVDRFEALSDGAKEQVSIIGRLAMAEVLAGSDRVCLLLDDALAFTSERRFARMASVLAHAATRMQIVVFTCDWERYRAIGVDRAVDLAVAMRDKRDAAAE